MGFLVDNKASLFNQYDFDCITSNEALEIWLDAQLQVIDQIMESSDKMQDLISIDDIPEDLIQHLSSLVGWRQTDYKFNFLTFRELVKNIVRIYKIKGRRLSYDTFFRAIGYIPQISECWYDRNGKLVETKPVGAPDQTKPTNVLNKSNWLQITLDLEFNNPAFPEPLSDGEFIRIILEYLKFLKPVHIRYKPILINVPGFVENVVIVDEACPIIILGDYDSPPGVGFDGLFEDKLEGDIIDDFQIFVFFSTEDSFVPYYNNTLRYGNSVAKSVEFMNMQFPVRVIQRNAFKYGGISPIPDEFRVVIQTDYVIPEQKFELRYNNFVYYNNQTTFAMNKRVVIDDSFKFDSQAYGFAFGNDFGAVSVSGDPLYDFDHNTPGFME